MLGWYLTIIGCVVSWSLHPEQNAKDTINADMAAIILLPIAAASHLISLSRNALHNSGLYEDVSLFTTCQAAKAIETPAQVVFVGLIIFILVYALPALHHCKRGMAVALVIVVCFITQLYTYDTALYELPALRRFSKFMVQEQHNTTWPVTMVMFDAQRVVQWRFSKDRRSRRRGVEALEMQRQQNAGTINANTTSGPTAASSSDPPSEHSQHEVGELLHHQLLFSRLGLLSLLFLESLSGWHWMPKLYLSRHGDWKVLFPETTASLRDYEQIVAAMGGAIALGLNISSVGIDWWKKWRKRVERRRTERG